METPTHQTVIIVFTGCSENIARLEGKEHFLNSAKIVNEPQLGYCVRIELYSRTVSSGCTRFSLVFIGHYRGNYKNYENKGIG